MTNSQGFLPLWASPPGETIQDVLQERSISLDKFGEMTGLPHLAVQKLMSGATPISLELAERLSEAVGASPEFWITRDCQYRDDLDRVEIDSWIRDLPTRHMEDHGWIKCDTDWASRATACFQFFGVEDVSSWQAHYEEMTSIVRFRISGNVPVESGAVAAWLRQGEIEALDCDTSTWNPQVFRDHLDEVRRLTRKRNPRLFVPELSRLCAHAGVALVVLRAPRGCPVSGVSRFVTPDRAAIVLSGRYLRDDHFWFTFFHEAGHLLLHDPEVIYMDDLDRSKGRDISHHEREADDFAMRVLLPLEFRKILPDRRILRRDIVRLALEARVAPGIVVGQLQHAGILGFQNLNMLKRRYRWVGSSLEMA